MVASSQLTPGTIISLNKKFYRVESCVKVTVAKGTPFMKTKLRDLASNKVIEKNFKPNQTVEDVPLVERPLEYLYMEGKDYLFLDVKTLDQVTVPAQVVGNTVNFLKEGVELIASFHGEKVFDVQLPQFLELMVGKVEGEEDASLLTNATHKAVLETGAKVEVPPFIEVGDIIKVDTTTSEYVQRV